MIKNTYIPPTAIHPGEILHDFIESRGLKQNELAIKLGMTEKAISEIINKKKGISEETALNLSYVFSDTSALFWSNLQNNYRYVITKEKEIKEICDDSNKEFDIIKEVPYLEFVAQKWVKKTDNILEQVLELRKLFEVSDLTIIPTSIEMALRESTKYTSSYYAIYAWWIKIMQEALLNEVKEHNAQRLRESIQEIRYAIYKTKHPRDLFNEIEEILSMCGVSLILAPHTKSMKIQGLTKWINDRYIIGLTLRNKWADIIIFSLFHELGHVLLDKKKEVYVCKDEIRKTDKNEILADAFACDALINPDDYKMFISKNNFTDNTIREFANDIKISTGTVVGRLQHDKLVRYNQFAYLRDRYEWVEK